MSLDGGIRGGQGRVKEGKSGGFEGGYVEALADVVIVFRGCG